MKIFIAGVMQGSLPGDGMLDQTYRERIGTALQKHYPEADIIDPIGLHPNSLRYNKEEATQVLFDMAELAATADIVIAYLPTASMGTAQEMVRAYDAGKTILTISPMQKNWFVDAYSTRRFDGIDTFISWLDHSKLEVMI